MLTGNVGKRLRTPDQASSKNLIQQTVYSGLITNQFIVRCLWLHQFILYLFCLPARYIRPVARF